MARLGHLLSGGRHVAKILMLYPIDTFWTNYRPQESDNISDVIEQDFNYLTDLLLRLHFDFDYTDEDILSDASVIDGKINIRDEYFELLILPPLTHLKTKTFIKLQEFVASGGKVIASTLVPLELIGNHQKIDLNEVNTLFGIESKKLLSEFQNGSTFNVISNGRSKNVHVVSGKGLYRERKQKELKFLIESCIVPDVTIDNENIFYLHRIKDNFDIYFFVNTQQESQGEVEITFEKIGQPELWNASTGEIESLYIYKIKDGRLSIKLFFPETESHIVILRNDEINDHVSECSLQIESVTDEQITGWMPAEQESVFARIESGDLSRTISDKKRMPLQPMHLGEDFSFHIEEENIHCISQWKMKIAENSEETDSIIDPDYNDHEWLDVTLGAWEMQLLMERDEETYPVDLLYRTSFDSDYLPDDLSLLVDGLSGKSHDLYINGIHVKDKGTRSKIDAEINAIPVRKYVHSGKNCIVIKLTVSKRTDGILDLLRLTGNFSLAKKNGHYVMSKPVNQLQTGDWTKQGYPYFSGTGVYEKEIEISSEYTNGKLFLEIDCGEDVLSVCINDGKEVVIPWHPYHLDITDMVHPGKNKFVLKVTNTLINMLEAVEKKSGLQKEPIIKYYHRYTLDRKE
jgi:hypothetical protein